MSQKRRGGRHRPQPVTRARNRIHKTAKWLSIGIAVVLGMYVSAYYATVNRGYLASPRRHGIGQFWLHRYTVFGTDRTKQLAEFFAPAHQMDRWLRRSHWHRSPTDNILPLPSIIVD